MADTLAAFLIGWGWVTLASWLLPQSKTHLPSLRQCDLYLCHSHTTNVILGQHLTSNEPGSYGSSTPLCYVERDVKEPFVSIIGLLLVQYDNLACTRLSVARP